MQDMLEIIFKFYFKKKLRVPRGKTHFTIFLGAQAYAKVQKTH